MAEVILPPHAVRAPEPNPHFVFPLQSPMEEGRDSLYGQSKASSTRHRPQHLSFSGLPPPLPQFDFHPTPPTSANSFSESPSRSPGRPIPKGHRRNGSELIGGDSRNGGAGVLSSSPTKSHGALPAPPLETKLSNRRRGHAHKRSGAVSSHDLSSILSPPKESRANSLPTTPSQLEEEKCLAPPLPARSASHPEAGTAPTNPPPVEVPDAPSSAPPAAVPRPRVVGFADKLEYISRPLSTISSETSSSISTIRPSHSVSGSVTSIVGEGTPSPPAGDALLPKRRFEESLVMGCSPKSSFTDTEPRKRGSLERLVQGKSKAGIEVDRTPNAPAYMDSEPSLVVREPSLSASSQCSADRHSENTDRDRPSGTLREPCNIASIDGSLTPSSRRLRTVSPIRRPSSSPASKTSKMPKGHRSWIDPFRSRRTKSPPPEQAVSATEDSMSVEVQANMDEHQLQTLDIEDSVCIPNEAFPRTAVSSPQEPSFRKSPTPSPLACSEDPAEILDLDALLTGSGSQAQSTSQKNRMHSSMNIRTVIGPGYTHRRADSAPEMAPPTLRGFGLSKYGSNNAMADVFEEEEEDDGSSARPERPMSTSQSASRESQSIDKPAAAFGVQIIDMEQEKALSLNRAGSCHAHIPSNETTLAKEPPESEPASAITQSSDPFTSVTHTTPVDIANSDDEPRASTPSQADAKSTQAIFSLNAPFQYSTSGPYETTATPGRRGSFRTINTEQMSSTVSSPDFASTSFDVPRLDTARSSITDRTTLNSTRNGNPSSYRGSVDDVPSLASAASSSYSNQGGQPRWSGASGQHLQPATSLGDHRNFSSPVLSLSDAASRPATASKRASLASFSRLMGGSSHTEKSKLSIEHRPTSQDGTDGKEKKRGKRISRLMNFFKSKDRHAT